MNIMFSKPIKKDNTHIVEFIVKIDCIPPIASINLKGAVYITPIDQNEAKRIEEDLSNSTPPQQLFITVYSYTLPMIALLSRELGLPPPIQIPLSSREEKEGKHYHM